MNPNIFLKEIQDGDQESFKRLFHLYYDPLVIYAERYLYDRASSEDMVQEAFIYIWEHSNTIEIKTSFKAYLYTMVRNRCLNNLKTIKITDDIEILDYIVINSVKKQDDFQDEKIRKHKKILLFVETLPERMKAVFNLKYTQHYSHSEISNELGISKNTIKTQLKRAKTLLQSQFPFYFFICCLQMI